MSEKPALIGNEFNQSEDSLANGAQIDTGFLDMATADKYQISFLGSVSGLTLETQSQAHPDDPALSSSLTYTSSSFYNASFPVRQRYMRFILKNNTGSPVTNVNLQVNTSFGSSDKMHVAPLGTAITDATPAALTKSVLVGSGGSNSMKINSEGAVYVAPYPYEYDYIAITYPTSTSEVYTYKTGGSGGATVGTMTINYTDSTKAVLLNVART